MDVSEGDSVVLISLFTSKLRLLLVQLLTIIFTRKINGARLKHCPMIICVI